MGNSEKPLAGIRVLDLTTFVAAPVAGRLLADLGAEVIKIERDTGDTWRYTGINFCPNRFSHDENPGFDIYNAGKRHIALNLKTPEGMEIFHKLLEKSDVFLTNTRNAGLKRLGIDYESIKEKYPRLIYAMVTGYGDKGPDKDSPAFDTTAFWARSGVLRDMAVVRENGESFPGYPPSGAGDTVSAFLMIAEIATALFQREKTGKGQLVKSCLYHNGLFVFGEMQIISQRPWGRPYPLKREDHNFPGGTYQCKDGEWIFIAGGLMIEEMNRKIVTIIGRTDLLSNPLYDTHEKRVARKSEYYHILRDEFLKKSSDEWVKIAAENDYAALKLRHYGDVSEDEQAWANGYLEKVTFKNGRTDIMPRSPIEMETVTDLKTVPAPEVGANTVEILKELGYNESEIAELEKKGITAVNMQ